ncbi:MAG: hypothetical protein R3336_05840 [Phycisphaeraceae bacterium]|nr:hypothetical protein [Phycisphaeraceae bacterium]
MRIYAGIDEAGYGPLLGPLAITTAVLTLDGPDNPEDPTPDLWARLPKTLCRTRTEARDGRIAVNDSKKIYTPKSGLKHLERGVLAFLALGGDRPDRFDHYLAAVGERRHRNLADLPWYAPSEDAPWQSLPTTITNGEAAVDANALAVGAEGAGIQTHAIRTTLVLADQFNTIARQTRNKANLSFGIIARHLVGLWRRLGERDPQVVIDRQSGRRHYREPIAQCLPEVQIAVIEESDRQSVYRLTGQGRSMTLTFATGADEHHLPVALASMAAKYSRELMMVRLQHWFTRHLPEIRPTAGYGRDGRRFKEEVTPHLAELKIDPDRLWRIC